MKRNTLLLPLLLVSAAGFSQTDEKFSIEQVKQQCAGMPIESRARMSVTRFTVTTSTTDQQQQAATGSNARSNNILKGLDILKGGNGAATPAVTIPPTLGENLTTMLTNALQGVNCFRVLESLQHNDDLTGEINAGNTELSSRKAPKAGKQLGAQIVVTGEVIEFSDKSKKVQVLGVGSGKKVVKMGFNLKLINPETRDVIVSHVFRVESRTGKNVSVLGLVGTSNSDPATAAVMEDGVIQAVQYIARVRDSLKIDVNNIPGSSSSQPGGINEIEVVLANANFASYSAFAKLLSETPDYQSLEKSLSSGTGSYSVKFKGNTDQLVEALFPKLGTKYEITDQQDGKISVKAK
ncbi:CsgG/HfaB family protein [Paraflavitalea pollutisoli]|uniref:CsgG/HfaB family protein n=1 Tax=Paraflavitalea pollutisoli TaxID=3034143 RepID=UPI0023ED0949|nr:CsgG/HfaB family protein [Paraflavitalea sp. H1-2-19X]